MAVPDEALILQILHARTEALGELYDRHGRLVYSLAYRILQDAASAEEVTQDVFVQVWNKAGSYQPELGRVVGWLARIARNRAIDTLRRRQSRADGHTLTESLAEFEDLLHTAPGLELQANQREAREQVRLALQALPPDQLQPLLLAYFEGLSHQQIADRLNEPLGTIKTRVRLGLQKLRRLLEPE